jgi:hypothetical protein
MRVLLVSKLDRQARAINTITKYIRAGQELGHEIAVFGEQSSDIPGVPYALDVSRFDYAVFVVYETWDFPDLPYLAQLLDGMPKERRVIIDCIGRYNDTIRVEHDFNHLEKMDGHQGWEWVEGIKAVSEQILQPTLQPLRSDVRPFLFHGFDAQAVTRPYTSPSEAAEAWCAGNASKPYGAVYVGNNWQRWSQMRLFLESTEPLNGELPPICLAGSDWEKRPEWAIQLGIHGSDVDPDLLERLGVETSGAVPFDQVVAFLGQGRFAPVIHRPLFSHLGLVTNRTFETFCADALPLLMLPQEQAEAIYGPAAQVLVPGADLAAHIQDANRRPQVYWDAVLEVRAHLAEHHSYRQRLQELTDILSA